jgi:alanine racemase
MLLYGIIPSLPEGVAVPDLRPAMTLKAPIALIRELPAGTAISYGGTRVLQRASRVATLPIGYADGYPRALSNKGSVLIRGKRAPILGRVCMDMTMVDVTDIPDVGTGDEAVMIGQQGGLRITAAHLATWAETIPYEILCAIGPRVRRVYR